MTSEEWLSERAPGFRGLSQADRSAILDFAFLWSLFEARVLDNFAQANRIRDKVDEWIKEDRIRLEGLSDSIEYFRNRYFDGENFTHSFDYLNLRPSDNPDVVRSVLSRQNESPRDQVLALLMVVWRLRNNLFHGMKWAYGIRGQFENFRHANAALMSVLDQIEPIE